jgi:very-short-patch-repair endonuclease
LDSKNGNFNHLPIDLPLVLPSPGFAGEGPGVRVLSLYQPSPKKLHNHLEFSIMATNKEILRRARELRQSMTPAEAILWKQLRSRRFNSFKFRRQRPIGPYIVDFFCRHCLLIVELDGDSHVGNEETDAIRQKELEKCGYRMIRFWNSDVYDDLEMVLDTIYFECDQRRKTPHP